MLLLDGRGRKLAKKNSDLEKLQGDPFKWDAWKVTLMSVCHQVLVDVKEGRLTTPLEVFFTSATDELLAHIRLRSFDADALEHLQSDESKWQNPEIFPVTASISDAAGVVEAWEFDPRPKSLN